MGSERYLVASPADLRKAADCGMKLVNLGYRISNEGDLVRATAFAGSGAQVMGISDEALESFQGSAEKLCGHICYEAKNRGYSAVLLDFERPGMEMYPLVSALSHGFAKQKLRHFVPARFYSAAPGAMLLVPAAVSGGSFQDMCRAMAGKYGKERLAFEMPPVREDFLLPSIEPNGRLLSKEELSRLMAAYAPSVFYSKEMASRYFTYRDKAGQFHFVLFDDFGTVREKLRLLEEFGDFPIFILYSDWRDLNGGENAL